METTIESGSNIEKADIKHRTLNGFMDLISAVVGATTFALCVFAYGYIALEAFNHIATTTISEQDYTKPLTNQTALLIALSASIAACIIYATLKIWSKLFSIIHVVQRAFRSLLPDFGLIGNSLRKPNEWLIIISYGNNVRRLSFESAEAWNEMLAKIHDESQPLITIQFNNGTLQIPQKTIYEVICQTPTTNGKKENGFGQDAVVIKGNFNYPKDIN